MKDKNQVQVKLDNNQAQVILPTGSFQVAPKDMFNGESGCPMQLMLGALGACIMLTVNAVARKKGIVIDDPGVRLNYSPHEDGGTCFQVELKLDDYLTDRERKILYQSARICEVGKIIKGDVHIDYQLSTSSQRDVAPTVRAGIGGPN